MPPRAPAPPPLFPSPFAALLSYLVPGLGQLSQGRVGKGLLFFFCIYGLFFYGMALGHWKNVFLLSPDESDFRKRPSLTSNLYNRPQFLGQFWVGVVSWPAIRSRGEPPRRAIGIHSRGAS